MGKESITLSMELAKTQCYEFECFEDNYSARRDVRLTQGSLIPKEHSLYRALKHSIRQHKLDLNLSKTKQPLPIITNSHLKCLSVFQHSKRNFVSLCGHVIPSFYSSSKLKTKTCSDLKISRSSPRSHFVK